MKAHLRTEPSPVGPIERFMTEDHVRIDGWVRDVERPDGSIDEALYLQLRHDLLRHIGMEEMVLLPYCRRRGACLPDAARLHEERGAIARLLVRRPSAALLDELRTRLARHNAFEEGPDGLYSFCDAIAGPEAEAIVERLRARPIVPLARWEEEPLGAGR